MSGPAPSLSLTVFAVVLASALLHAGWNAFVRAAPDKLRGMAVMSMGGSALCALALPFVAVPPAEVWPWLGIGFVGSLSTQALIAQAYARGELSVAYPLQRGLAPIAVTTGSAALFAELPGPVGFAGIGAICCGVAVLAFRGLGPSTARAPILGVALLAALLTALYTLANAKGARLSVSAFDYAIWASVPNGAAWAVVMAMAGRKPLRLLREDWIHAAGSGTVTTLAFILLLWASRHAPVAMVSALRETSILFGLLIAWLFLGERLGAARWTAAGFILCGVVLLRFS
ncbi:MAG: EamA family transporter [Chelatococcus sp.]|nr:MAG: EamA family transporter [Chelatococcus sp.]